MDHLTIAQSIGILIAAALTLMMYSFLYRDNFFYKFGEHLYVGISNGYFVNITWYQVLVPQFIVPFFRQQEYVLAIPAILGLMMLARFVRQISWRQPNSGWHFCRHGLRYRDSGHIECRDS